MSEVAAPMPGTIVQILVKEGDQVSEDQDVMILEAMKMENPIAAPATGAVASITVKEGDKVDAGQVLMTIE
ncbi:Biotin-requiring enzyme [Desulfatibacillum alkenivorans DSM 16219]|jgi:biotin carboxyl carrier protein|uniref:Biotin-requiring enzyme n=1 Tax=Desulfatibacillum alkenivorans DSM 16219 TaxID=1121393 RepID=A0A1M6F8D3_9BACT|nr:acetyl-CoA carboxylase biotin carboxyl carrier protein subunit [Desulfatibacillum alkenivorans]SHI93967.1 Biotin-requiring enzyme [Desulfatibacillum alkenivorans DSM 16219]